MGAGSARGSSAPTETLGFSLTNFMFQNIKHLKLVRLMLSRRRIQWVVDYCFPGLWPTRLCPLVAGLFMGSRLSSAHCRPSPTRCGRCPSGQRTYGRPPHGVAHARRASVGEGGLAHRLTRPRAARTDACIIIIALMRRNTTALRAGGTYAGALPHHIVRADLRVRRRRRALAAATRRWALSPPASRHQRVVAGATKKRGRHQIRGAATVLNQEIRYNMHVAREPAAVDGAVAKTV
jgi:hypothetical protein